MISYTITVCNEDKELAILLDKLLNYISEEDELVIQMDSMSVTSAVRNTIDIYRDSIPNLIVVEFPLDKDFAQFKNNLKNHCSKKWIFNIDADEIPTDFLLTNIRTILETNDAVDMFLVPRWNTVFDITPEHIKRWGWQFDEQQRVNWPDYQTRIYKNKDSIIWKNKVHERIFGFDTYANLPDDEAYCLYHMKSIEKQEHQNNFYSSI
jgi:hypothetical protein